MISVLNEILEWSYDRPLWQRDALRRLMIQGNLSDDDIFSLIEICKSKYGLAEQQEINPLSVDHIPETREIPEPVILDSIFHQKGVNALADDQLLSFSPHLTVVYGDNGSGKTGYSRILKNACRARGQEKILGNVVSGSTPPTPSVKIKYRVGYEMEPRVWNGDPEDKVISRISVFDSQSASIYLTEKTDVAYRPFGLDLFDKLTQACKAIRIKLETEQRSISTNTIGQIQSQVPENTQVAKLLTGLNSLTKPETIREIAVLSSEDVARINYLEKTLQEIQSNNQEKLIQQLLLRAKRIHSLIDHLKAVEEKLSKDSVDVIFKLKVAGLKKSREAKELRQTTFSSGILPGTGNETWKELWEAARKFSQEYAYAGIQFPFTEHEAVCVLCQQELNEETIQRLRQFQTYVVSTVERELNQLRERYAGLKKEFTDLTIFPETIDEFLDEISIDYEDIGTELRAGLQGWEQHQEKIINSLADSSQEELELPEVQILSSQLFAVADQIESRIKTLQSTSQASIQKQMQGELSELKARKVLSLNADNVINEIERLKKYAAYNLSIDETKTQSITQQSSIITKKVVSQRLKDGFQTELRNLKFRHVEVELKEMGGSEGVFYHKLILTRAPNIDLPKVVSEGEQRCLSIAAFFAELTSADDQSGIVFDDPVSSLDFRWRNDVARRLVEESLKRQVIIFTHDIVFMLAIKQYAEDLEIETLDQFVRHLSSGAGVCTNDLPWIALSAKKKISYLKNEWQAANKRFRDGEQDVYERHATYLYGLLRETWERAIEEILLNGIVERYRPSVQTQRIKFLPDITKEDCETIENAMTKCSVWLPGHDTAPAAKSPIPEPDELKADIDSLENWMEEIRRRRT